MDPSTDALRLAAEFQRTVIDNPWIPQKPTPKQALFLLHSDTKEAMFGGAAGGSKTSSLLAAAAQYVDTPGYSAILFRNTNKELEQADGLVARSREWWHGRADYNADQKKWTFPSGATVRFAYLERDEHALDYRGGAFQFIAFDELTLHSHFQYTFLFRSLRRPTAGPLAKIPLRVRSGTNPGGPGSPWVRERFIPKEYMDEPDEDARFSRAWWKADEETGAKRLFVPARLADNPHIDRAAYMDSLSELDPVSRAQQLHGDWRDFSGGRFLKDWFRRRWWKEGEFYFADGGEPRGWHESRMFLFMAVEPAASERKKSDFTAIGVFAASPENDLLVLEMVRKRLRAELIIPEVVQVVRRHPNIISVGIENQSFQRLLISAAKNTPGMPPVAALATRNVGKLQRAYPAVNKACEGKILFPRARAPWIDPCMTELLAFSGDPKADGHDDVPDLVSWGVAMLRNAGPMFSASSIGPARDPVPASRRLEDRRRQAEQGGKSQGWGLLGRKR